MAKREFRAGDKFAPWFTGGPAYIKVLAVAEGYVMARYAGCIPFVKTVKEFTEKTNQFGRYGIKKD